MEKQTAFTYKVRSTISRLFFRFSIRSTLTSPTSVCFPFTIALPSRRTLSSKRNSIRLLRSFQLFLCFTHLSRLIRPLFNGRRHRRILLRKILMNSVVRILRLFKIRASRARMRLLRLQSIPLRKFGCRIITNKCIRQATRTLLHTCRCTISNKVRLHRSTLPFLRHRITLSRGCKAIEGAFTRATLMGIRYNCKHTTSDRFTKCLPCRPFSMPYLIQGPISKVTLCRI